MSTAMKIADEAARAPPIVEMTGGFPVLLPCPSDYLQERDLNDLREIERHAGLGRRTHAQRLALALETRLGITMADRLSALKAASETDVALEHAISLVPTTAVEAKPLTRKERRAAGFSPIVAEVVEEPRAMELPAGERGRSKEELKLWDRRRSALLNPNLALSDEQKQSKVTGMAQIEAAPKVQADADWLRDSTAETIALANARGEEVSDKAGRKMINTRDSLLNLINAGKIDEPQAATGRFCRDCYEARSGGLGATTYGDAGGGGHDHEAFVVRGFERAKMTEVIAYVERFIAITHRAEPVVLQMFRAVLRDNIAITAFGTGEATRIRNTAALVSALESAAIGIQRWKAERASRTANRPASV